MTQTITPHQQDSIAIELASRIVNFDLTRISEQALSVATTAILDTVGVTLAALEEPAVKHLKAVLQTSQTTGSASLLGSADKASVLDATLINATASHALDYDDFSQPMGGHQSVPLVAALLAVAESKGLPGRAFLNAYIIGIETEIRIARAVNFHHYDKGWHPTATLGIFGTVAACGHLLGLTQAQMACALSMATSLASGLKANFGTMVKPLHVGNSARNGLLAVQLAQSGYDANLHAFEHKQGFLNVFNGFENVDVSKIFTGWASPLEIFSDQMGLKQFPSCGSAIPAVTMMLNLSREESFSLDDVQSIEILLHRRRLVHTDNPNPTTAMAAKFSAQYAVCRALVSKAVRIADFESDAFHDPLVRKMMTLTKTLAHPDMAEDSPNQFGAEVRVHLKYGQTLSRRVENLVGRGVLYPMSDTELWEKYSDCAQVALPAHKVRQSFEALRQFKNIENLQTLIALLCP